MFTDIQLPHKAYVLYIFTECDSIGVILSKKRVFYADLPVQPKRFSICISYHFQKKLPMFVNSYKNEQKVNKK